MNKNVDIVKTKKFNIFEEIYTKIGLIFLFPFLFLLKKNKNYRENFLPLFKLIHKSFVRSSSQTFMAFWFPLIFISILGNITNGFVVTFSIATYIPLVIGVQLLPSSVISYKRSSLLKRIGATKLKTSSLIIAFISYYSIVSLFSIVLNVSMGILFFRNQESFDLSEIMWLPYVFSIFLQMILAFGLGMIVASTVKTESSAIAVSLLIILPGAFLAGQFIPITQVNQIEFMRYLGWLFPQKGPTVMANIAISGDNPFNFGTHSGLNIDLASHINWLEKHPEFASQFFRDLFKDPAKLQKYMDGQRDIIVGLTENILCVCIPLVVASLSIVGSLKLFKWHSR